MNKTNMKTPTTPATPVYFGVDVAKAELVADCQGTIRRFENNPKGVALLLKAVSKATPVPHLVCEATAGYEQPLALAALSKGIRISIVPPQRVRSLAKSSGKFAKSDPIDARLLSHYGTVNTPEPSKPKDPARQQLDHLMRARSELMESLQREMNRSEHHACPRVVKIFKSLAATYQKQIRALDTAIAKLVASDPGLSGADAVLRKVTGVGPQTSRSLLAFMPELGLVGRRSAAALAGLAPYDRDSGRVKGKRHIQGGRSQVRRSLHMAAVVASSHNPELKKFYDRLMQAGKPFKVAIVAVTRKLLVYLNSQMAKFLEIPVAV